MIPLNVTFLLNQVDPSPPPRRADPGAGLGWPAQVLGAALDHRKLALLTNPAVKVLFCGTRAGMSGGRGEGLRHAVEALGESCHVARGTERSK